MSTLKQKNKLKMLMGLGPLGWAGSETVLCLRNTSHRWENIGDESKLHTPDSGEESNRTGWYAKGIRDFPPDWSPIPQDLYVLTWLFFWNQFVYVILNRWVTTVSFSSDPKKRQAQQLRFCWFEVRLAGVVGRQSCELSCISDRVTLVVLSYTRRLGTQPRPTQVTHTYRQRNFRFAFLFMNPFILESVFAFWVFVDIEKWTEIPGTGSLLYM